MTRMPVNNRATKNMWHGSNMPARPVQVSMDAELLRRVDADPEVRQRGRSAFIRSAIEMYLRARRRREIDEQLRNAYGGHADEMLAEISDLMDAQAWPPE